ncbi:uncharacterized protein OCT59_018421 [Rhizophagus irregularis]|uniref:uncharacterized protein n=1 Tax=Rhizophagus irregularis TaxID=588596 RepID=UPI003322E493|nr:hypothetical protein OCT59_018421 [Rhizophagus irregularis]
MRDEEKATLIARLDDDIKEIKQSSASTSSVENSDICQPIRTEIKTLEEKEMDAFLNEVHKKSVSNEIRKHNKKKTSARISYPENTLDFLEYYI